MQRRDDERFMTLALREAAEAAGAGEVPVGAVLVDASGAVLAGDRNRTVERKDPTAHAEILALRAAAAKVGNFRLTGTTLYVTVEPCCMCAGALVWARVKRLVFGAHDPKGGAAGSLYLIVKDERLNHRLEVTAGVLGEACGGLMQQFFRNRRRGKEKM